jgi:iron complex outermembrane receptor protein
MGVYAQEQTVTLNLKNASLKQVFNAVEKQTTYRFSYRNVIIDKRKDITISKSHAPVSSVLNDVLRGRDLGYSIISSQSIVITDIQKQSQPTESKKKKVSGVVKDASNNPIIGANVSVKGVSIGAITDLDGKFSLDAPYGSILQFSYIGYKSKELKVASGNVSVTLEEDTKTLDEVIVVGYGTQKKKEKTGAAVKISANDFNKGVLQDPIEALQGKVAGVTISKQGGDPNGSFSIKVRGSAGMGSGTEPLYVVDGVPGVNPNTIAPEDIESFDVLKDASSAAIYGSRGSNGVVMITTKKGKNFTGKPQLEYNTYFATESVLKRLDLMSASDYRIWTVKSGKTEYDGKSNTNWENEIFRNGITQNHNLSISNSWENGNYRLSLTYNDLQGVVKSTDKSSINMRANFQQNFLNNHLRTTLAFAQTYENNHYQNYSGSGQTDVLYQAFARNPTYPVYNSTYTSVEDMYNQSAPGLYSSNPVAYIKESQNKRSAKRNLLSLGFEADLFNGLTANVRGSYHKEDGEKWWYAPSYLPGSNNGTGKRTYDNTDSKIFESYFNYKKMCAKNSVDVMAGYSFQEDMADGFSAYGEKSSADYVQADNLGVLAISKSITSYKNSSRLISIFGRVNYDYDKKYYFTGTMRRDGSSKFGANHEWGMFPSFSVAWDITKEKFMEKYDFMNYLKLRGGVGVSGNQDIDNYLYAATYSPNGTAYDESGNPIISLSASRNANPNLKWEQTTEYTVGVDFGFFNDRISGAIDLYKKVTSDLLYSYAVSVPPNLYSTTWANAGEVQNKGIEVQVSATVIANKRFTWKSNVVFSLNRQKFTKLGDGDKYKLASLQTGSIGAVQGMSNTTTQIIKEGGAIGDFYGAKCLGISSKGEFLYATSDGGTTTSVSDATEEYLGSALPKFELAWTNALAYKNFDLSFTLRGEFGHKKLNATRMWFGNPAVLDNGINGLKEASDMYGILTSSPAYSSYYIENASYVRLTNLQLGYNFPVNKLHNVISKLRFYLSANNLFTITGYKGLDPESQVQNKELSSGVDVFNVYPKTRFFSVGLNVSL